MSKWKLLLSSRKFWAALIGVVAIICNDIFNINLPQEQIVSIVILITGWIVGQGIVDAGSSSGVANDK